MGTWLRSLPPARLRKQNGRNSSRRSTRRPGFRRIGLEPLEGRRLLAADLELTKTDSPDPVLPGQTLEYNISISNIGDAEAADVTLIDLLPANATFLSASTEQGTVSESGGVVTGDLGTIIAGDTVNVVIRVTPDSGPDTLINEALVATTSVEDDVTNNDDTETTTVDAAPASAADLSVTKDDSPDPVTQGDQLTYTISINNLNSANDATDVELTDVLPAGTTFVSASSSQGTVSESGGVVTGDLGTIAAGDSATVTIVVVADEPGTLSNSATATTSAGDSNTANNTGTEDTTVEAADVDLGVTKDDSPDPVTEGDQLTYTVTVGNFSADNDATDVELTDVLPVGTTFVSASSTQGTVSHSAGVVTADLGTVTAGDVVTVTIIVTADQEGTITNTATVTTSSNDTNAANDTATEDTTVEAAAPDTEADLEVTKVDSADPVQPGQELTYTITVANLSEANDATSVTFTDVLPAGVTFISASSSQGSVSESAGTVTGNLGTIPAGAAATVTIVISPNQSGTLVNTAAAATTAGDSDATNNTDTELTTVEAAAEEAADLEVAKSDSPDPVTQGDQLTYTVTVSNLSTTFDATDSRLTDVLPAGVTFVSASASQGTASESDGVVTADLGTIAADASATVTIVVVPNASGTITNTATATTSAGDTDTSNNTITENTTVQAEGDGNADLTVSKSDSPDPVTVGQNLTYTILVSNAGGVAADNVTLSDVLPGGVTFVSASSSQGSVSQSGGVVSGDLGTIGAGGTATVTIVVRPNSAGTRVNTVTVATTSTEDNTTNNSDTETTTVITTEPPPPPPPPGVGICNCPSDVDAVPRDGTEENFIRNLYEDILNRVPEPDGFQFWRDRLGDEGDSEGERREIIGFFLESPEYLQKLVQCFYEEFLNRPPDGPGLDFWVGKLQDDEREEFVIAGILGSPEYFLSKGSNDTAFVIGLYEDLLGRVPDPEGLNYWVERVQQVGREQVARDMTGTEEFHLLLINDPTCRFTAVDAWNNDYLQGQLSQELQDDFFDDLQDGDEWRDVQEDILALDQYFNAAAVEEDSLA